MVLALPTEPLSWSGGEIPDPLVAYTGSQSVGPVFHIYAPLPLMLRLYGPKGGQLPLIGITGQKTATLGVLLNNRPTVIPTGGLPSPSRRSSRRRTTG